MATNVPDINGYFTNMTIVRRRKRRRMVGPRKRLSRGSEARP